MQCRYSATNVKVSGLMEWVEIYTIYIIHRQLEIIYHAIPS